jgi:hypothetical protein
VHVREEQVLEAVSAVHRAEQVLEAANAVHRAEPVPEAANAVHRAILFEEQDGQQDQMAAMQSVHRRQSQ